MIADAAWMEPTQPGDHYADYCQWPYDPPAPTGGKLRQPSLLWAALDAAGAHATFFVLAWGARAAEAGPAIDEAAVVSDAAASDSAPPPSLMGEQRADADGGVSKGVLTFAGLGTLGLVGFAGYVRRRWRQLAPQQAPQ